MDIKTTCNVRVIGSLLLAVASVPIGVAAPMDHSSMEAAVAQMLGIPDETDHKAPIDYGPGPGQPKATPNVTANATLTSANELTTAATTQAIPTGGTSANTAGVFGAPVTWPIIPIHVILLPDGRVMSYGTNESGQQGAQLFYDVWNPALGIGASAHTVLSNTTNTDIFCGAQSLMLSGNVLVSGGDLTVNGLRNSANNHTNIFSPSTNTLTPNTPMSYARWYGTLVGLPNGHLAIFGGRQNVGALNPVVPSTTPEIYDPALSAWTSLTGATSFSAFGANWWYPRAFVAPGGEVFVIDDTNGKLFYVSVAGSGSTTQYVKTLAPQGNLALPTVSFAPGKLLSVRLNQTVIVVDFTTSTPVITQTDPIDQARYWANGTVLADGRVLITGGSAVSFKATGVDYQAEIWDPKTGHWTAGASASKPRLYHSTAMLLSDGTVLTGGGGAPGPVINLNAEIYYPPYLYAANGTPAVRPTLSSTNLSVYDPGDTLSATVGPTDAISRLTLVRTGSSTHSLDADARFIELSFTQTGRTLVAQLPGDTTVLVPGYYMLFAINTAGVPSVARVFPITANGQAAATFSTSPSTTAFGVVQTGTSSAAQTITVTDTSGTLAVSGIAFSGPGAKEFSQTNNCGNPIPAGSSCAINAVFTPNAGGYNWATLSVTGSGVTQTAMVNGTGSVPFTVSPATVSLGTVSVGTPSAPQTITVTNTGSVPLLITSITFAGTPSSQFSQTNNCSTVAVGSSCTVSVVFTPAATGYVWAKLNVNTPGLAHNSTVSGTGQ